MTTHNNVAHAKHRIRIPRSAEGMLDTAQSRIERMREAARERGYALLDSAKERGAEALDQAREQGKRALDGAKDWASENPAQAAGVAFVAGVIVTRWLSGGKKKED
jgi:ElaB/YqjD/DUF883 family membrane-anchored ribosome-binding protein